MKALPQTPSQLSAAAAQRRASRQDLRTAILIAVVVHLVVPAIGAGHRNCVNRRRTRKAIR